MLDDRDDVQGVLISQISATAIQALKLSLIAYNYNDVISLGALDNSQLYLTP